MSPSLTPAPSSEKQLAPVTAVVAPRRARAKFWPIAALALIVLIAAGWTLRPRGQAGETAVPAAKTARVVRGALARTLRLTGTVSARNFASIVAPVMQGPDQGRELVLIYLGESGSRVKKGDLIGRIDGQSIKEHVDDLDDQIIQMGMEFRRLEAQQSVTLEQSLQRVRVAKAEWEKAKLSAHAAEVRNLFDQELLRLDVEQARLEYEEAAQQIPLVEERHQSERAAVKLREYRQVSHRGRHLVDLSRFEMRAPMDGQLILKTVSRNGQMFQVRLGDQVNPGQSVMRVVDLSSMMVEASMNQTDSESIQLGQKATVHFDAYPDLVLEGHVEAVGMLATSGRRGSYHVRRVPVRIAIDGSDPRVIPDLTASADVVIGEEGDSLVIPRDAVTESRGKPVVFVKSGETLTPREVEIGTSSTTQVTVVSGLQEGEEIAVQPEGSK